MNTHQYLEHMKKESDVKDACEYLIGKFIQGAIDSGEFDEDFWLNAKKLAYQHYGSIVRSVFEYAGSEIEKVFLSSTLVGFAQYDPMAITVTGPMKDAPSWAANTQEAWSAVRTVRAEMDAKGDTRDLRDYCDWLHQSGKMDAEEAERWKTLIIVDSVFGEAFHLVPQAGFPELKVNKRGIRTDAMIFVPMHPEVKIVVECDGYEWHGGKDSFVSDRKRDRLLASKGYEVMRFSGSEICADPVACSVDLVHTLIDRRQGWLSA